MDVIPECLHPGDEVLLFHSNLSSSLQEHQWKAVILSIKVKEQAPLV